MELIHHCVLAKENWRGKNVEDVTINQIEFLKRLFSTNPRLFCLIRTRNFSAAQVKEKKMEGKAARSGAIQKNVKFLFCRQPPKAEKSFPPHWNTFEHAKAIDKGWWLILVWRKGWKSYVPREGKNFILEADYKKIVDYSTRCVSQNPKVMRLFKWISCHFCPFFSLSNNFSSNYIHFRDTQPSVNYLPFPTRFFLLELDSLKDFFFLGGGGKVRSKREGLM